MFQLHLLGRAIMHILKEPESTDITLTRDVIRKYKEKWEQDIRKNYKRVNADYPKVNLERLGEFRSSRWYSSFNLKNQK